MSTPELVTAALVFGADGDAGAQGRDAIAARQGLEDLREQLKAEERANVDRRTTAETLLSAAPFAPSPMVAAVWRTTALERLATDIIGACIGGGETLDDYLASVFESVGPMFAKSNEEPLWAQHPRVPLALVYFIQHVSDDSIQSNWPRWSAMGLQFVEHFQPLFKICGCVVLAELVARSSPLQLHHAGLLMLYYTTVSKVSLMQDLDLTRNAYVCLAAILAALEQTSKLLASQLDSPAIQRSVGPVKARQRADPSSTLSKESSKLAEFVLSSRLEILERVADGIRTEQRLGWIDMLAQEMHERTLELGPDATSLLKVLVPSLCLLLESNFSSAIVLASSSLVGLSLSAAKRLPFYRGPILRSIAVACKQIDGDTPDSVPSSLESLFSALWTCCGEAAMQHDWTALKSVPFVSKVLSPPPLA